MEKVKSTYLLFGKPARELESGATLRARSYSLRSDVIPYLLATFEDILTHRSPFQTFSAFLVKTFDFLRHV